MNSIFFRFFILLFVGLNAYSADTISLHKQKVLTLKNWEIFFPENKLSVPVNSTAIPTKSSFLKTDSVDLSNFNGICWFRKIFYADSSFKNKSVTLNIQIIGAAELFLNGSRIAQLGEVGFSEDSEHLLHSSSEMVSLNLKTYTRYELLIRYSNHALSESYDSRGEQRFGLQIQIKPTDFSYAEVFRNKLSSLGLGLLFFTFFATLFFVHLIIFFFNKKQVSNLYYSLFCFFIALLIVSIFSLPLISDAESTRIANLCSIISPVLIFIVLPVMLRSLFQMAFPRWYLALCGLAVLTLILLFTTFEHRNLFYVILISACSIEAARVMIVAIRDKKQAVKIIGIGVLFFLLFVSFIVISFFTVSEYHLNGGLFALVLVLLIIFSIISIPISITVFLAFQISQTNKSLSKKLIEVEELSAKSLEQEKEKQLILENQKQTLEEQVKERTFEISEQKKIIEEKNKDIIDSITYAKRIQSAMLPDENLFAGIFKDAFVLYEPRDIVSGDFYYASQTHEGKLIVAADCTGHGVPGALMSMVGSNIINKLVHENKLSDPKTILEQLHQQLRHALKQDVAGSLNRDGMDVCAALITKDKIVYAGANRPLFYFSKENELKEVKATKTPVGGSHITEVELEQHSLSLSEIKQLFIFSDGFADQFGGPEGKKLMISRFKNWLNDIISEDSPNQKKILEQRFHDWKKEAEQVDDVMVIGIKV